jgi:hypothetical protein
MVNVMGLDITFDYQPAVDAGLELTVEANGNVADIVEAKEAGQLAYAAWLEREELLMKVPTRGVWIVADECITDDGHTLTVRANHWGETYGPLTSWLAEHGIEWEEW